MYYSINMIKSPFKLKCEYLTNPICVDKKKPRFSWLLEHEKRNQKQSAYRLLVASNGETIQADKGDMWDTGKVISDIYFNIPFNGTELESDRMYFWKVKWWDKNGQESSFSNTNYFGTALYYETDWKAKWITRAEFTDKDNLKKLQYKSGGRGLIGRIREVHAIYLRKEFKANKIIQSAKAFVCGLGYYEFRLNGEKISDIILDPAQTDYKKLALYSTFDITERLQENNAVGVIIGNGRCIKLFKYDFPKLLLQINIHYQDGSSEIIQSDGSWKIFEGPIRENGIYYGELYDARLEIPGWDSPNFDDSTWSNAVEVSGHKLVSQMMEPIKITKEIKPKTLYSPEPGMYIYDFGQNFTGFCRLKVKGPRGSRVQLRFSEITYHDGTLNTATNGNAPANDTYILKGEGEEIFEPHFTYHGFRYVEMTGFPGVPTLDTLEGLFFHSNVKSIGSFSCSNQLINHIHNNILWGQLSNLMSIPTDCPQRDERQGWMGDAQLVVEEAILNFDMARFYTKYLRDIKLCQKRNGSLSDVVPPYWRIYPADPAWGTAYITIAWYLYYYYNDTQVLEEHYDSMKMYVDYLNTNANDNLFTMGKYGDWCPPCAIVSRRTPIELTSSWYHYHDTLYLSKIAKILNKKEDFEEYLKKAEMIKEAFNQRFFSQSYSSIKLSGADFTKSQTSNILPLYLNMVPENRRIFVLETLINCIKEEYDYHFNTGIVGTRYIFDVLTNNGYPEILYKMVTQTSFPGYGYMIREGATTLWERWEKLEGPGMNSHNHIMLGSVDSWFYKCLAGINASEPGWRKIIIKPYIPKDMDYASGSTLTVRGRVFSSWEKLGNSLRFVVQIPIGVVAQVALSMKKEQSSIREGSQVIWKRGDLSSNNEDIKFNKLDEDKVIFEIGSGFYDFLIK